MIAYVILHYQNSDVTIKSVDSVLAISKDSVIIIVDNASPNKSGALLSNKYSQEKERVVIIQNEHNEGFAKGNNIGFRYAKSLGASTIVVMNSDIIITQNNFEAILERKSFELSLDVIGPNIITPDNRYQNPLRKSILSTKTIFINVVFSLIKAQIFRNNYLWNCYLKYRKANPIDIYPKDKPEIEIHDCVLHGSIIIFNQRYIDNENVAFLPITFLYGEEDILFEYLKYRGYSSSYIPDLNVLHLGGASTKLNRSSKDKLIFRYKQQSKSLFKLLLFRLLPKKYFLHKFDDTKYDSN